MAVVKGTPTPGAVILTEEEAVERQLDYVNRWKPESEVIYLKYSMFGAAAATVPFSVYLVDTMRRTMKVGKYGKIATYITSIGLPAFCAGAGHYSYVTKDIVIRKTECPSCVAIRSGFLQALLGGVYSAAVIPLGVATFASRLQSARLPEKVKDILPTVSKLFRPHKNALLANLMLQFVVGFVLSSLETNDMVNISNRFVKMQRNIEMNSES